MKEILEKSWKNVLTKYFDKGWIAYERQLQAYFFLELKKMLPDHVIWIEPMIFLHKEYKPTRRPTLDGKIPDMLITRNAKIEAVIELKCKPWDYVQYEQDLKKLKYFEILASKNTKIPLSWPPVSSNWNKQESADKGEIYFEFVTNILSVFAVIAKKNAAAVSMLEPHIKNFLHLKHSIKDN